MMIINAIAEALDRYGLCLRGGFNPVPTDNGPLCANGAPACTVLMVGNFGSVMWERFSVEHREGAHPLDSWTELVLTQTAGEFGASAVFPFQRPYLPFQRWSLRAENCHASPLGILIHPQYGLWHAYRGALLFPEVYDLARPAAIGSPCATCRDRPCLSACPVSAFTDAGYDVPQCVACLTTPEGKNCMEQGCRARRACPVGRGYQYAPSHARFHMEAFRSAHYSATVHP